MTQRILLTKGYTAVVDDEDYDRITAHKWRFSNGYAKRTKSDGRDTYMHREIITAPSGMQVDHINGNRLDNRKTNLRLVSNQENSRNSKPKTMKNKTSTYKGVIATKYGRYEARIKPNGKSRYLGSFATEEEAARAYDKAAIEHFGEYAWLNFKNPEDAQPHRLPPGSPTSGDSGE